MKKIFRTAQFLSNIATIIIAVLLGLVVVKIYLFNSEPLSRGRQRVDNPAMLPPSARPVQESPVGKSIAIENVNWKENGKTLVLYVSATCHFCTESSPFYQRLVKENSSNGVTLLAVLPQSVEESKAYLKAQDINITQVYNTSLASIGVRATPTLLLVDEDGVVAESWRGKLTADQEAEVLNKLSS
jgi:peroxiredoxin